MESTRVENLPPPPGVISSIRAGFDAIAAHLTAILLPLLLDLFLWLGPRLRMDEFVRSFGDAPAGYWRAWGMSAEDINLATEQLETGFRSVNLFWLLRTLPIGIPSLRLPFGTSHTPLGDPAVLQVNALDLLGWILLLTFFGWVGGGLYFRIISALAIPGGDQPVSVTRAVVQTILLSLFWSVLSLMVGVPLLLVLVLLLQLNPVVANIAVLFLSLASMWVIVPVFFWPHGVFLKKQNFIVSIITSFQMARFTLPTSSMFILTVFLLSMGLNYLWSIPAGDSWMTLVGILGHAFVTTALLAASFIYYRDMNLWLQKVIERLKAQAAPRRA